MRGQTTVQKIIARAAGRPSVAVGDYVDVSPDYVAFQELYWPMHRANLQKIGVEKVAAPEKMVMVVDHTVSRGMETGHHETQRSLQDFTESQGITNFFKAGNGLRHLVLAERGFARPGLLIFSDEGNIASIGALGALNVPISTEVFASLVRDVNWVRVPETARIVLTGSLPFGVTARDLIQTIIRDLASGGRLLQRCVEFTGPAIAALSLDDRQTILASLFHAGAYTGLMPVDEAVRAYVAARADGRPSYDCAGDPDAEIAFEARYDLSALKPMVTVPPDLDSAVPVESIAGLKIDQATIGSCAGNRLSDMRAAASILKGRRIAEHVVAYITPGSREVYAAAAREGLLEIFADAGAAVLAPGCTTCWGYQGVLAAGERLIATQQFNYRGRNGSRDSEVYLAGPYAVAAAAVAGRIVDPREFLSDAPEKGDGDGLVH